MAPVHGDLGPRFTVIVRIVAPLRLAARQPVNPHWDFRLFPGTASMDSFKAYAFHHGFAFRRESFGGILYHYEGVRPDPRVTFVDHPFLMDLLERVEHQPLDAFIAEVCRHFSLPPAEEAVIRKFFATLIERGALVESSPPAPAPVEVGELADPNAAHSPLFFESSARAAGAVRLPEEKWPQAGLRTARRIL